MEYTYMVDAFIEDFSVGDVIEPPKHVHVTIKKKFRLKQVDEKELISTLEQITKNIGPITLKLGESKIYDDEAFEIIEVKDASFWRDLHFRIVETLGEKIESRDLHFETDNYLPHVSWKVRNEITLDPKPFFNSTYILNYVYLIERIDPDKSITRIVAKLPLS